MGLDDNEITKAAEAILAKSPSGLGVKKLAEEIIKRLQDNGSIDVNDEAMSDYVEKLRQKLYRVLPPSGLFEQRDGLIRPKGKWGPYPKRSHVLVLKEQSRKSPRILVTYPLLGAWNYWESTHLNEWLQNPIDKAERKPDHMYEIRGKIVNPEPGNVIKIGIVVDKEDNIWEQIGGEVSPADGNWNGKIWLPTENEHGRLKVIHTIDLGISLFKQNSERPIHTVAFTIRPGKAHP